MKFISMFFKSRKALEQQRSSTHNFVKMNRLNLLNVFADNLLIKSTPLHMDVAQNVAYYVLKKAKNDE